MMQEHKKLQVIEEAVLGALLNAPEQADDVLALVSESDFSAPLRQKILTAIREMSLEGLPIDAVTVGDRVNDIAYLVEISQNAPAANNAKSYAAQLEEHSRTRKVRSVLQQAVKDLEEGGIDAIEDLPVRLEQTQSPGRSGQYSTFSDALSRGLLLSESAREAVGRGEINFGLPALDERLPVLRGRGLLVVVAARPSVGKTALSNQLSLTTAKRGLPVGKIELEMSIEEMALRSISAEYHINNSALAAGQDEALDRLTTAVQERNISSLPIYIDDGSYTTAHIIARIAEWHRKYGIVAVTVDHLHLVAHQGESRNQALGEITRALKLCAKRLKMPIFLMSQLARLNERENRRPKLSDLRDSGAIEQDADIVIALHSDGLDADENGIRWIDVGLLKNRGGRTGWVPRSYAFDGRYQTFTEHALRETPGTPGSSREAGSRGSRDGRSERAGHARGDGRTQGSVPGNRQTSASWYD